MKAGWSHSRNLYRIADSYFLFKSQFIYVSHAIPQCLHMHINASLGDTTCKSLLTLLRENTAVFSTTMPSHPQQTYAALKTLKTQKRVVPFQTNVFCDLEVSACLTSPPSLVFLWRYLSLGPVLPFPNLSICLHLMRGADLTGCGDYLIQC